MIWLLLLFLWSVIGRLWWSIGLLSAVVIPIAAANRIKINLREEPIYPSDIDFLSEPGFLSAFVSPTTAVLLVLGLGVLVAGCVLVGRRLGRRYPRPSLRKLPRKQAVRLGLLRLGVLLVTATLLFQTTKFNEPGNLWRKAYEIRGEHWRYWNQKTNYRSNGFVGGFLYNMPISAMAKPTRLQPRPRWSRSRTATREAADAHQPQPHRQPRRRQRGARAERVVHRSHPARRLRARARPDPADPRHDGGDDLGHDARAAVRRRHRQHGVRDADRAVDRALPAADGLAVPDARLRLRRATRRRSGGSSRRVTRRSRSTPTWSASTSASRSTRRFGFEEFIHDTSMQSHGDDRRQPLHRRRMRRSTRCSTRSTTTTIR